MHSVDSDDSMSDWERSSPREGSDVEKALGLILLLILALGILTLGGLLAFGSVGVVLGPVLFAVAQPLFQDWGCASENDLATSSAMEKDPLKAGYEDLTIAFMGENV